MDSESKELMREWLVRSLEPVCDADPEVLSKYVLALIQNDPKKEGLRETCISKLEEFLGDETTPFVNRLFSALETNSFRPDSGRSSTHSSSRNNREEYRYDDHESRHSDSRRRPRGASDDERDEDSDHGRYNKQRRREEEYSPRRGGDARYGGRDGGRNGGRGGQRGGPGEWDRRRNFPPEWGMPPPGMWPHPHHPHAYPPGPMGGGPGGGPGFHHPMGGEPFDPNVYDPASPGMMPPPHMMMGGRGPYPYAPPYGGRGRGRGHYHSGGRSTGGPPRGEESGAAPAEATAKTTLRVSNVDPKYINMTKLSLHFSKFGNVVNVQMRPQHKCAYVQYASEEEAKKAFHSPIPVCNNRFIEVKWAKYDAKDPHGAPSEAEEGGGSGENGAESASTDTTADADAKTKSTEETEPEKTMTTEELRAAALEKGRKVLEQKRELLEKQKQLMKQKEDLLKRQLAQQKELLERMSQNPASVSAADKRDLLNKITALSEELKALQPRRDSDPSKLSGLQAELSALEAAAGGRGGRGRGGRWPSVSPAGRGFYRGGRGGRGGRGYVSNTLDNRTTIVKVENLPDEARDPSVLEQHFGAFGGVDKVVVEQERGFIKFVDRYSGQTAFSRGSFFGQNRLQLSWVEPQDAPAELAPPTPTPVPSAEPTEEFKNGEVSASA